jgi:hypothetical protein
MDRRAFAKAGAGLAVAPFCPCCAQAAPPATPATPTALEVRPYQLMCVICRLGEGCKEDLGNPRLTEILRTVRRDRKTPVRLRMNASMVYRYQNPGPAENTPEGPLFNVKRDLDILQRLGLAPGDARPAIDMFERVLASITTSQGICGSAAASDPAWRGCAKAGSGHYEKGRTAGIKAILAPRDPQEKAASKKRTAAEVYAAKTLLIRPHHLLCMSCFYGRSGKLTPLVEDNLFEAVEAIQKNPDLPIKLVSGCCMICPPCSHYEPSSNLCLGGRSMALRDEKKDLDTLAKLGLAYGVTLPAKKLYTLLFERIASPLEICGYGDGKQTAPEWSICGSALKDAPYQKARREKLGIPGA